MNVYTSPDFRGEGYAKDSLDAAIMEAKRCGVAHVILMTTKVDETLYTCFVGQVCGYNIFARPLDGFQQQCCRDEAMK